MRCSPIHLISTPFPYPPSLRPSDNPPFPSPARFSTRPPASREPTYIVFVLSSVKNDPFADTPATAEERATKRASIDRDKKEEGEVERVCWAMPVGGWSGATVGRLLLAACWTRDEGQR